jgi:hypothetical protein
MSYWDISSMAGDVDLQSRVAACAAQEQHDMDPQTWMYGHMLEVCAAPGWGDAWASAVAGGVPDPGRDPAVIADGQILASVQTVAGGADA